MRISDWSSHVCSSDLRCGRQPGPAGRKQVRRRLNETATLPREILSHSNTLIKRIRSLRDKKHRREERLFLAEGLRIVTEAADAGRRPRYLVYSMEAKSHPLTERPFDLPEKSGADALETRPHRSEGHTPDL